MQSNSWLLIQTIPLNLIKKYNSFIFSSRGRNEIIRVVKVIDILKRVLRDPVVFL